MQRNAFVLVGHLSLIWGVYSLSLQDVLCPGWWSPYPIAVEKGKTGFPAGLAQKEGAVDTTWQAYLVVICAEGSAGLALFGV